MTPTVIILAFLCATLPVFFWFFIFKRNTREQFFLRFFLTFALAAVGGIAFWQNEVQLIDLLSDWGIGIFLIFFVLGTAVEYFKNFIVRIAGFRYFKNIDDVMDLSFASALGFTFGENLFHFLSVFSVSGQNPVELVKFLLERELFILPVHLVCSGLFGYFYGVGLFASEEIKAQNERREIFQFLKKAFFFLPQEKIFQSVKILEGTLVSVSAYALFFFVVQKDPTTGDILQLLGMEKIFIDEKLLPFIAFAFFQVGTIALFTLLDKKRRWDNHHLLVQKK